MEGREKGLGGERVDRGDGPFPFAFGTRVSQGRQEKKEGRPYVETALNTQTDTALETISGMLVVVEVFIVSS